MIPGKTISPLAASILMLCSGATVAASGRQPGEPPVPLGERTFFARGALSWDFEPLIVPVPGDGRPNRLSRRRAIARQGEGGVLLAAFGGAKGTSLIDADPAWSVPGPLPWAAAPAVPPLLSTPPPKSKPRDTRLPIIEDPAVRALEMAMAARRQGMSRRTLPFETKHASTRAVQTVPCKPTENLSKRWTDPLATFCVAEDKPRPGPEFIMPFANGRVTSLYNQGRRHPAIDLAGALGSPVIATTSNQTVIFAGWRGGYGNAVITRDVYGWTHLYGHLKRVASKAGQRLDQGDTLGLLGSTGRSTGPHVHYEVKDAKGRHVNPVTLLFPDRKVARGYAWRDVKPQQGTSTVAVASNVSRFGPR